jgi:hypothetical protein
MIYEGMNGDNSHADYLRLRMPHARNDEPNHRSQAPPASPEGILDPFARFKRVSGHSTQNTFELFAVCLLVPTCEALV